MSDGCTCLPATVSPRLSRVLSRRISKLLAVVILWWTRVMSMVVTGSALAHFAHLPEPMSTLSSVGAGYLTGLIAQGAVERAAIRYSDRHAARRTTRG